MYQAVAPLSQAQCHRRRPATPDTAAVPDSRAGLADVTGDVSGAGVQGEIAVFEPDVEGLQIDIVYTQAVAAISAAFLLALLVVGGLWKVANQDALTLWMILQTVQSALRLGLVYRYRQATEEDKARSIWMVLFFAGALVSGIIWGCIGLLFSFSWPLEYQTLTLLSLAGVLSGAISSYSAMMSIYIAFMVPCVLIPAQSMLLHSNSLQANLGLIMMLYAGVLLTIARNYNKNVLRSLQLRLENQTLVDNLQAANRYLMEEINTRADIQQSLLSEQKLFTNGPVTVFRWSADKGWPIEYVSDAVSQFGYNAVDLVQQNVAYRDIVHPDDLQRVVDAARESRGIDYRVRCADGRVRWVYDYSIPVKDSTNEVVRYTGYILDITDRKASEYELQQEKERAEVTLHSIAEAVITTDVNGQIEYLNPQAEALTGWDRRMACGLTVSRVFSMFDEGSQQFVGDQVHRCLRTAETVSASHDVQLVRHDGEQYSVRYSASPIMSNTNQPLGVILVFHDVTDARKMERKLSYQATHDALTGLLNRAEFEVQLGYAVDYSSKSEDEHVLCFIDIDQLKIVNDTGSHEIGDELLKKIATILQDCLRDSDTVARLGGDEFGALLKNCTIEGANTLVENLLVAVNSLRLTSNGQVFEVSASVGMTRVCARSNSVTHVMSEADLACNAAKDLGGNRCHIYHSSDEELMRRQDEMQWVSKISEAIQSDRLVLYYQRIAPAAQIDNENLHFEILVRMLDDKGGLIMPDRFLPAAERYNLITGIDRWVVSHSFSWFAEHCMSTESLCLDTMAINLSGVSITDVGFHQHIKDEMEKYGVSPASICFEITETAAISNLSAATEFICDLRKLGCRFALDDFGSGLSSFGYLKNLPVDYLKIDGAFVRDMDTDAVNYAMVSAIQQLGSVIGIQTIAEFVENDRIIEMLVELGVDFVQGYAISRPLPLADLDTSARCSA